MNTKAIIFDLDGVITDTAKYHYAAWKQLADELNMYFDEEINERLKGVSRMQSFEIILEVNNSLDKFTNEEKEKLITKKNDNYIELIKQITPDDILPGISDFINEAKNNKLKLAVASVSKNAQTVLESLQVLDLFDYIADAKKITKSKPDPEIFLVCAQALGIEPKYCVGIEDAQAGIEAIKAAGMYAIGLNVTITSIEPDLHLKSSSELIFNNVIN